MLRRETRVSENQFGFMPGGSITEAIHLLRSLMEKYRERQRDLHMAFLYLEKAHDIVPRELVWRTLINKGTPRRYLRVIRDMYKGAKTHIRIIVGNTELFPMEVELNNRLESWREAQEGNGLRVSREKAEYLRCDFSRSRRIDEDVVHRIRADEVNKVEVAEFRMLRWTYGKTRVDMISNGVFRAELDVDSIIDKMRE
ncbi:retrovirus-related pol polyprotein LINE-1 [Tanacetum coccineum]